MFGKSLIKRERDGGSDLLSPLANLQKEINELFGNLWSGFGKDLFPEFSNKLEAGFFPRVNVSENENAVVVTAELPGVEDKDLDVSLDRSTLTIRGEKRTEEEHKEGSFYRAERSYGSFERSVPLPADVVTDKVEATFSKGVLTVTLPKSEEARKQVKRVKVKTS
jgi:HSP20 family protein